MDVKEITIEYADGELELITKSEVDNTDVIVIRAKNGSPEVYNHLKETSEHIYREYGIPVLVVDTDSINTMLWNDEELAKMGLKRIDDEPNKDIDPPEYDVVDNNAPTDDD